MHPENPLQNSIPNPALVSDLISELLNEEAVAREMKATGKKPGPVTGIESLDEEVGGFLSPGVHTLLAAPGAGKTALALQIAVSCGCPALYVTAEMRRAELLRRVTARVTSTYLGKLRGGELTEEELRARLSSVAKACPALALYDATLGGETRPTPTEIQERADALRARFKADHVLIIVDSVTEWAPYAVSNTEALATGYNDFAIAEMALNGLKQIATHLTCPVLAIAHRNRAGQGKDADKLHSAKGTGRYEYISEGVWDLERDPKKQADEDGRTRATLTILKNRYGATGLSLSLQFEGRLQKFIEA
jgi:replicative DNA helicase